MGTGVASRDVVPADRVVPGTEWDLGERKVEALPLFLYLAMWKNSGKMICKGWENIHIS